MEKFAKEIGAEPRDILDVSKDAEVLILSIPFGVIPKLSKQILRHFQKIQLLLIQVTIILN